MNRIWYVGLMLLGGELLAYGWPTPPPLIGPTPESLLPLPSSLAALVLGAVLTLWALQRIGGAARAAGSVSHLPPSTLPPYDHDERNQEA